jgi:hypothetical protein
MSLPEIVSLRLYQNDVLLLELLPPVDGTPPDQSSVDGPVSGLIQKQYSYSAVSTDSDHDPLFYRFEWGDGSATSWLGPYESSEICSVNHSWSDVGSYQLVVRVKDIHDMEGSSSVLEVSMPRVKNEIVSFFSTRLNVSFFLLSIIQQVIDKLIL